VIQPDFSAALVQRGKILAWQGDFANAVKDLKKAKNQDEFVFALEGWWANCRFMKLKKQIDS
jgi:hypothetical protein